MTFGFRRIFASFFSVLVLVLSYGTADAAIVYNFNRTIGTGSVAGFIETDGTIGFLGSQSMITDWSVTLAAPNLVGGSPVVLNKLTSSIFTYLPNSLIASPTQLFFDFNAVTPLFIIQGNGTPVF